MKKNESPTLARVAGAIFQPALLCSTRVSSTYGTTRSSNKKSSVVSWLLRA